MNNILLNQWTAPSIFIHFDRNDNSELAQVSKKMQKAVESFGDISNRLSHFKNNPLEARILLIQNFSSRLINPPLLLSKFLKAFFEDDQVVKKIYLGTPPSSLPKMQASDFLTAPTELSSDKPEDVLAWAAYNGHIEQASNLLAEQKFDEKSLLTAVDQASTFQNWEIIELIYRNCEMTDPLINSIFISLSSCNNLQLLQEIFDDNSDKITEETFYTSLKRACIRGDFEVVSYLLNLVSEDPNQKKLIECLETLLNYKRDRQLLDLLMSKIKKDPRATLVLLRELSQISARGTISQVEFILDNLDDESKADLPFSVDHALWGASINPKISEEVRRLIEEKRASLS